MDKWLYGYWFRSKKKTFGWGWTIIPNTPQGYITWGIGVVCCILLNFPGMISYIPQSEVMIVSGAVLAVATLVTFVKTNFRDDPK